jgi:hypothetical protein
VSSALERLHALAAESLAKLPGTPGSAQWARAFEKTLATAHTAAYYAATAERLGVSVGTLKGLSRAERDDVKKAVAEQVAYLKKFVGDTKDMSDAAIAARAQLYAGSVKATYYAARWGDWDVPQRLMPGMQQCLGNCKCDISIKDSGDGTGVLTRTMRGAEHHCTECPPLQGDHPVKRRAA